MGFLDGLFQKRKHVRHDAEDDDTDPSSHTVVIRKDPPPARRSDAFAEGENRANPWADPREPEAPPNPVFEDPTIPPPRLQPPPPRRGLSPPGEGGDETVIKPLAGPQRAGRVVAVLVGVEGPLENEVYRVYEGDNVLGRQGKPEAFPNNQETKTISREHATLRASGEHFLIEPTNPKNATFVNGQPVDERSLVQHGDRIGLGNTKTATFVLLVVPTGL